MDSLGGAHVVWVERIGLIHGLGPTHRADPQRALPESVEAQTRQILLNLDEILAEQELARDCVVSVRVHLTQFGRFHERFQRAFAGHFSNPANVAYSCVGVTDLPRDALLAMDFMIQRR